ncbi:MAG: SDR family NAD(P)-dependent oxidoreductase, partial [Myxococcaceae bacterium]
REVALRCAARGDDLFVVGRDAGKLTALVRELGDRCLGSISADLAHGSENAALVEKAIAALGTIDLAVVAHGLLGDQLESERSYSAAEEIFIVNLLSAISLIIPLANQLEQQRHGTLAVITSVAADRGRPRNYTYGAAKAALNVYLQGLRSRLYGMGVKIVSVRLGPVETPMTVNHEKNALFAQPGPIAEQLLSAFDHGREDFYLPWYWRPIMSVVRNLPERIFQRFSFLSGR